jgi:hypothetical protein
MPDFVVVGAQKSASTFLQDQLDQHPCIEIAPGEARHFEDPDYQTGAVDRLPALFTSRSPQIRRGIKRPDYLGRPEIPERLHRHLPSAQLFAVLREPVSRAVSAYYHYVRHGFVPLMRIDEAFDALLENRLVDRYPRSEEILSYGLYARHLRRFGELFPSDRIMVMYQDNLIADPASSLRSAFEFLDVDPSFVPGSAASVSNRGVYWAPRLRLLRTKNHVTFRYTDNLDRRYPRRVGPAGWLWNASVVGVDRMVLSRFDSGRPPPMSEATKQRVQDYYAADTDDLAQILDSSVGPIPWLATR